MVSLSHPNNSGCLQIASSVDLWVCQYCVAENMAKLRDSKYVFFTDLFAAAREGALFIITEVTPRLWPDFVEAIQAQPDLGLEVAFVQYSKRRQSALRRHVGRPQLVLRKKRGAS